MRTPGQIMTIFYRSQISQHPTLGDQQPGQPIPSSGASACWRAAHNPARKSI